MRKPNRYLLLGAIVLALAFALTSMGFPLRSKLGLVEADYRMIALTWNFEHFTSAWWKKNEHRLSSWTKLPIDWKSKANKSTWGDAQSSLGHRHNTTALLEIYCPEQPFVPTESPNISKRYDYGALDHWLAASAGVLFDSPTGTEPITMPSQLSEGKHFAVWQILEHLPAKLSPYQSRILLLALWTTQSLAPEHQQVFEQLFAHGYRDVFLETAYFDVCHEAYLKDRTNELRRLQLIEQAQLLSQKFPGFLADFRVLLAGSLRVRAHHDQAALDYYLLRRQAMSDRLAAGDEMDRAVRPFAERTLNRWNTETRGEIFGADARPIKL